MQTQGRAAAGHAGGRSETFLRAGVRVRSCGVLWAVAEKGSCARRGIPRGAGGGGVQGPRLRQGLVRREPGPRHQGAHVSLSLYLSLSICMYICICICICIYIYIYIYTYICLAEVLGCGDHGARGFLSGAGRVARRHLFDITFVWRCLVFASPGAHVHALALGPS